MKVALVSSAWPPVRCGVGDYTSRLADALEGESVEVVRFGSSPRRFDTRATMEAAASLRRTGADIVHVQYPAVGYGRSLLPATLPLALRPLPVVVTLHEFSIFRFYRWPWFAPFAYAAAAAVFTNAAERQAFGRRMPGYTARADTIPIGSNMPRGDAVERGRRRLCYFGLITPGKGLEEFFTLLTGLQGATPAWRPALIGAVVSGSEEYAKTVMGRARELGAELHIGLEPDAVAAVLQQMEYAYLPGPGGITDRRGTVLAALDNGVRVVGPTSGATPAWMKYNVIHADSPAAACDALLAASRQPAKNVGDIPEISDWPSIARRHRALYQSILSARSGRQDAAAGAGVPTEEPGAP